MQGLLGSGFQRGNRMFAGQGQQAMQDARADGAALFNHRFGPSPGVFANQPGPIQQVIQIALNDAPIRGMLVERVGGKFARLGQGVQRDLFPALVENTDQSGLPAHPDLPPNILRGHRIIGPLDLNVTVPVNAARRFFKDRKQAGGQRQQFGPLHLVEHLDDLLPGGAVNARVGHASVPNLTRTDFAPPNS